MSLFENCHHGCQHGCEEKEEKKRDHGCHPCCNNNRFNALAGIGMPGSDAFVDGDLVQIALAKQVSHETINVKDSCDVFVQTSSDQATILIQVALQVLIGIVVAVLSDVDEEAVVGDLEQIFASKQVNRQNVCIENSRNVRIEADTDQNVVAVQVAIQVLVAVVVLILSQAS